MNFRFPSLVATTLGTVLVAAVACTSSGSGPKPTASPAISDAVKLQTLARIGSQQSYTAIYALTATQPKGSATVTIRRTPSTYRLDLTRGSSISFLIHNARGTFSCQRTAGHKAKCLQVAKPGSAVPSLFDAGQKLWSDYLVELSTKAPEYVVTQAGSTEPNGVIPPGTCFTVAALAAPTATSIAAGTYCLTDDGIPTRATFPSGTVQITRLILGAPATQYLQPQVHPTPIPNLR